ncbi:MAG TPA: hypothetical protein VFL94_15350 [Actinomycetales bacterium]|nr:hypothetical protein [Actinomycetales bacterium]
MSETLPAGLNVSWVRGPVSSSVRPGTGALVGAGPRCLPDAASPSGGLVLSPEPNTHPAVLSVVRTGRFVRRSVAWAPARRPGDVSSRYLLCVQLFVPRAAAIADCRSWLDDEHAGRQLAVAGASWYGGYESLGGDFSFLNLWGIDAPEVIETPEWAQARDTPWRERLLPDVVRTERALFVLDPIREEG